MSIFDKLPVEIQEQMLKHQVEQGNPRNPDVFKTAIDANSFSGGFDWVDTPLNKNGWRNITKDNNYNEFYEMYPNQKPVTQEQKPSKEFNFSGYPKEMIVSGCKNFIDCRVDNIRTVLFEYNNKYWAIKNPYSGVMRSYRYAKDIPKLELTVNEAKILIAELKKMSVNNIKII